MSQDKSRLNELQGALRSKMADNKAIADSFRVEDGTVVVTPEQKTAFDKNMSDIKEIKSLIDGMQAMDSVESWSSQPTETVAGSFAAAAAEVSQLTSSEIKSIGEMFLESAEFKSLANGRNGANMVAPWQVKASFTGGIQVKDVYSAIPNTNVTGSRLGTFGSVQRDAMVTQPMRTKRVRDLFPVRTTTAAVIEYFRQLGFTTPIQGGYGFAAGVNSASTVAERNGANNAFAMKPQSSFSFVGEQAPIRTLARA